MAQTDTAVAIPCNQSTTFISNLFRLPAELRLQIYGLVVAKPKRSNIEKRMPSNFTRAKIKSHIMLPALMRVSKVIREDAIRLYQQHLLDARAVLKGRKEGLEKLMRSAERASESVGTLWVERLWQDRAKNYREQLKDNREWLARVDEVAANIGRVA
ncbi:hypothetical protein LTS10_009775 [Elasticomyces elasticus]|nr:hypothetical protein LTS10_009775 [Elasticomyces elasticus]